MVQLKVPLVVALLLAPCLSEAQSIKRAGGGGSSTGKTDGPVRGEDYLWTYFETPLSDVGQNNGHLGPTNWKKLPIPNNQCGGGGQLDGFGQSPIVIPSTSAFSLDLSLTSNCESNLDGFVITSNSTCTWLDLDYPILKSGLVTRAKLDENSVPVCSMGKVTIPDSKGEFEIKEIRLKMGAEHVIDGHPHPMEIEVLTDQIDGKYRAAFSIPIEIGGSVPGESAILANLINGWKTTWTDTIKYCEDNPDGADNFNVNSVLEVQHNIVCSNYDNRRGFVDNIMSPDEDGISSALVPNIVQAFIDLYKKTTGSTSYRGVFSYKGSLTRPPCEENVFWNVFTLPSRIRIYDYWVISHMIQCIKEKSTCKYSSASSEFGLTIRPPQLLKGRQIIHRCANGADAVVKLEGEIAASERVKYRPPVKPKVYYALLFPFFVMAVSLVIFYVLTRYVHQVPYTAVLFLFGTVMGIAAESRQSSFMEDQLMRSTQMFDTIHGNLLLLIFLPGLLFKDAYCLDVHLFFNAFSQVLIMGFPMVLAGTVLMAVFAFYALPYNWTFNFCMTFGAIVSATDPVAVAALLQELGAPPRLKTHIAGESLLNDGAAIVFFTIFESLYLKEQGLGGEDIGLGKGISLFAQKAIGAAVLGIAFGALLALILYLLNRRFNGEEKIVQVTATFCFAYLSFYIAEAILHWSGVICVVFCGLTTKGVANSLIIDQDMMSKFWSLTEHLLNTVLFTIAGLVWGTLLSLDPNSDDDKFVGNDWWYLILTYVVMMVVRFFLFAAFFPVISRIGLKSKWKEMVFQAFGGLRGAVGIALAILVNFDVSSATVVIDPKRHASNQLFGIVGGITLLTLFINGTFCGPLLKHLRLNRATKERKVILQRYDGLLKKHILDTLIKLLGHSYYDNISFETLKTHVPQLSTLTYKEIRASVKRIKYTTPSHLYQTPNLSVFRSLVSADEFDRLESVASIKLSERINSEYISLIISTMPDELAHIDDVEEIDEDEMREMRLVYVELLRRAYQTAKEDGNINVRDLLVVSVLNNSISVTEDEVSNGEPVNEWSACQLFDDILQRYDRTLTSRVHLITAFIAAHTEAQNVFKYKVHQHGLFTAVERGVLDESTAQIDLALKALEGVQKSKLKKILSLKLCGILLQRVAIEINKLIKAGLLKEEEGEHYLEHLEEKVMALSKAQGRKVKASVINNRASFLNFQTSDLKDDIIEETEELVTKDSKKLCNGKLLQEEVSVTVG